MGLSPLFIFQLIFFKLHSAGQRAPQNITFLLRNSFNSLPITTLCISGWQGALLAGIPACPPIGASFRESRYLLHSPPLLRPASHGEERSCREQCPLSSPLLRFKRLQFELCNLIRCRTRPVTQPQEGGTYTQTIVQTVHAETTPTCSHFPLLPHLRYYFQPSSLFLCVPAVCLLSQGWSLIVLLSMSKQDTLYCWYLSSEAVALVCQCRFWIDRLEAGSHACRAFVWETGRTSRATLRPLRGLEGHKEMSRWGGEGAGKYQVLSVELKLT